MYKYQVSLWKSLEKNFLDLKGHLSDSIFKKVFKNLVGLMWQHWRHAPYITSKLIANFDKIIKFGDDVQYCW